jgi:hypothetical protein
MVFVGVLLLLMGVLMLLEEMGIIYGEVWDYVVPVILVAIGVSIIFNNVGRRRR